MLLERNCLALDSGCVCVLLVFALFFRRLEVEGVIERVSIGGTIDEEATGVAGILFPAAAAALVAARYDISALDPIIGL